MDSKTFGVLLAVGAAIILPIAYQLLMAVFAVQVAIAGR